MAKLKHKKLIIALSITLGVLAAAVAAFFIYVGIYYHADDNAVAVAAASTDQYAVERRGDDLVFMPDGAEVGLIFYPGGKVEHTAYAPLMAELARRGIACVLLKMPFNLAVFDPNAADGIEEMFPSIKRWYVGGHSLGGVMAASYAHKHPDMFEGVVLLGSYSTDDLSGSALNVISIYGSEDGVLDMDKYADCRGKLPPDMHELVIDGGCHAYFGDYGAQSGDGTPTVTRESQQNTTAAFIRNCIFGAEE